MKIIPALFKSFLPIIFMIVLIPFIVNDYLLLGTYLAITFIYLYFYKIKNDFLVYIIGLVAMTGFETIFILTGVENFNRNSLFGIMPIWLPFLWAFAFVIMRRSLKLFD